MDGSSRMAIKSHFILLFCLFSCMKYASTADNSQCTVTSPSETKYLSLIEPLNGKTVTVEDHAKNHSYVIGFCQGVDSIHSRAGVEQRDLHTEEHVAVVGRINNTNIMSGTNWLMLEYRSGDPYGSHCGHEPRRATIFIMCDQTGLLVNPTLVEENNGRDSECAYIFEVGSSVACSNSTSPSPSPSSSSHGLSTGGIIVIIALVLAAAYLILGVLYKRCSLGAKGREQIPNINFWMNFGNLTADGCDFICRCNRKEESKSYKGLGDDQLGLEEEEERDDNILPMY